MDSEIIQALTSWVLPLLPLLAVLVIGSLIMLYLTRYFSRRNKRQQNNFKQSLIMIAVSLVFLVGIVLALPIGDELRKQLLALLGLLLTLMMAFSSTSFVANAMAGLMLRGVDNLNAGDFIRVGEQFGRVTERGLFHTEIQTQERDLTTIPNLYLVSNPFSVVRSSGTIVSAEVSLGYDNDLDKIEQLLLDAAATTGLLDGFVYVKSLDDFSVVYRVNGFLEEVKQLLTVRSSLRKNMIKTLHTGGIEIVSPSFMSQRVYDSNSKVIAAPSLASANGLANDLANADGKMPEDLIFDKAETAEKKAILELRKQTLKEKIALLQQEHEATKEQAEQDVINRKIQSLEQRLDYVRRSMQRLDKDMLD